MTCISKCDTHTEPGTGFQDWQNNDGYIALDRGRMLWTPGGVAWRSLHVGHHRFQVGEPFYGEEGGDGDCSAVKLVLLARQPSAFWK